MASFADRYPENIPGRYYVDTQCTDCDLCRTVAPNNFRRNDYGGYAFVFRQPTTPEEIAQCEEAVDACPCEEIGNDGDLLPWDEPVFRLVHAAARGDVEGVKAALGAGVGVNAKWSGVNAFEAARERPFEPEIGIEPYKAVIAFLLENGAELPFIDPEPSETNWLLRALEKIGL
jgi:ferredoxin